MMDTTAFSFITIAYPHKIESVVSYMEISGGAGAMVGPVIGSFIYSAVGFKITFFIFGALLTPFAILFMFALPKPSEVKER